MRLEGKTAFISGAARGLGAAVGVPAKIIGKVSGPEPSRQMDHSVSQSDDEA